MNKKKVILIGAGLTGLYTAYLLLEKGFDVEIIEARDRVGGRIHTITSSTPVTMEMGATWFSNQHTHLVALLQELQIPYFRQHTKGISLFETMSFVPPQKFEISDAEEPSFRIEGGTSVLINRLVSLCAAATIKTGQTVTTIQEHENQITVTTSNGTVFTADYVISTIPPNLLINTVKFEPALPENLVQLARKTHTWMGESIKFAVAYKTPFWREANYSGTLYSQASIIQEMYDHSTATATGFALKGFLNGGTAVLSSQERQQKVIAQLTSLFGPEASAIEGYYETVWRNEALTFHPYDQLVLAHQNNGHQAYQQSQFNGKLFLSGSETAQQHPGYMDGALAAAKNISSQF